MQGESVIITTPLPRFPRRGLLCLTLAASLLAPVIPALAMKKQSWVWKKNTSLQLQYEPGYNSNLLDLSRDDIDLFLNDSLTLATDVTSYDAFTQSLGFHSRLELPKWWGWRNGNLSYTFRYDTYAGNAYNDRAVHNAYFTHDLFNRTDIFASYLYIPQRYLRDYFDRDTGQVIGTTFAYTLGGVGLQYSPKPLQGLRLSGRYEFFSIYYNQWFTEYDSKGWGLRFDARYRFNPGFAITGIWKYRWSDNIGFVKTAGALSTPTGTDAEYGDGTYGEEWYELAGDLRLDNPLPHPLDLSLTARLRHRYYTSDRNLLSDPIHSGRQHLHWLFGLSAKTKLFAGLSGGPIIEYEFRNTDSQLPAVVAVKDFTTFRASLALSYTLW